MRPVIDLTKEYGLVLDGGGARGAYQIGAWKALAEAGVRIRGIAGTSVGALNGALICMGDVKKAEHIWDEMTFSKVMNVDDDWMERLFQKDVPIRELLKELMLRIREGGIDVTPLKHLNRPIRPLQGFPLEMSVGTAYPVSVPHTSHYYRQAHLHN